MTNFIQNVLQISITMAAVIGVLLLLVPVWQKRYSAKWRKAIWLIIAVRLLVPFSIELPTAPVQMNVDLHETVMLSSQFVPTDTAPVPAIPSQVETPDNVTVSTTVNNITPTITTEKAMMLDRGTVLFAIWLIGILAFTLYHAVQYQRFYGKIMASAKPLEDSDELLERAGTGMGLAHYPNVLISGGVQSPMLIGFRKPTIVLPYKLYGENELVMILRHELTHYKHHDLWYKLILLCANALHWFNPLVWLMNRQAGRDVEQVCDDYVVDGMDMEYRKAYSMTILNTMASQKGVALSTHLSKDAQNTKKRFAGILQPKTYKKGIAVFAAVLILAVGISGCLQVGDESAALSAKIADVRQANTITTQDVVDLMELEGLEVSKVLPSSEFKKYWPNGKLLKVNTAHYVALQSFDENINQREYTMSKTGWKTAWSMQSDKAPTVVQQIGKDYLGMNDGDWITSHEFYGKNIVAFVVYAFPEDAAEMTQEEVQAELDKIDIVTEGLKRVFYNDINNLVSEKVAAESDNFQITGTVHYYQTGVVDEQSPNKWTYYDARTWLECDIIFSDTIWQQYQGVEYEVRIPDPEDWTYGSRLRTTRSVIEGADKKVPIPNEKTNEILRKAAEGTPIYELTITIGDGDIEETLRLEPMMLAE